MGYRTGVASSRRMEQRLNEDIAFVVLSANNTPDFRKNHLAASADLFGQVLECCRKAGAVNLGHVALASTKVRANASKHKAMCYGRMKEKEDQLSSEVAELLQRGEEVDDKEDRRYGRTAEGTNCRRSWPTGKDGCERSGRPKGAWRPRPGRRQSRRNQKDERQIIWTWVGAHLGDLLNEACDSIAKAQAGIAGRETAYWVSIDRSKSAAEA